MFHYDITTEDTRLLATSPDGQQYQVTITDGPTGEQFHTVWAPETLFATIRIAMEPDEATNRETDWLIAEPSQSTKKHLRFIP